MRPGLRPWKSYIVAGLLAGLGAPAARAQSCPGAAACTPGKASGAPAAVAGFNMGILNVTLGSLNNTTVGQADGYQDYSCRPAGTATALVVGQPYTLAVRTSLGNAETVLAWIDYNNDGAFDPVGELVMAANPATGTATAGGLHTATFAPPATARTGVPLRLRVAADYANSPVPTPCSTPQYSQDEDYAVTLTANASPPVAAFATDGATTCSGCVQFTDASQNVPTAWQWDFGDGTAGTAPSPRHCYAAAGTYQVRLTATNANGSSTSAATAVTYNAAGPAPAACAPAATAYCCNYGVVRVRLGPIDNASADGSAGYQDFTCAQRAALTVGVAYPLQVATGGALAHDTRVYLDLNNDGAFAAAELLGQALNTASPTFLLTVPGTAVLNQPLRLRIVADYAGSDPQPCKAPLNGQVEDYTVIPKANTNPPGAAFASTYVSGGCVNPVQFTDQTTNAPTSWLWNFGDGTTSTQQNPSHQFTAAGTYTVALTATNANGTSGTSKAGFVISVPCLSYCASNGTGFGAGTSSPLWITGVSVAPGGFSNASGLEPGGYGSYVAKTITLAAGTTATLTVAVSSLATHRTVAWADFNQDGVFAANELLFSTTVSDNACTGTFALPATARLGRTRLRVATDQTTRVADPCAVNLPNGEVEDYTLLIQPATPTATAAAAALPGLTVAPNPTADGRLRLRLTDPSAAGPYAAAVRNLLGATLLTAALRLGPGTDADLDLGALAAGVYVLRLRDAQGRVAVRRVVRE